VSGKTYWLWVTSPEGRQIELTTYNQDALFRSSSTVEQAAVNRKVQGSNPCSGAKSEYEIVPRMGAVGTEYSNCAAVVQQRPSSNRLQADVVLISAGQAFVVDESEPWLLTQGGGNEGIVMT
jgi:hypothetical protein